MVKPVVVNMPTGYNYSFSGEERNMGKVGRIYCLRNIITTYKYRLNREEVRGTGIFGTFRGMLYLSGNVSTG